MTRLSLALAGSLLGLAAGSPALTPIPRVTVVAFGDSTTAVRGATKVYATILQEELDGARVINAGVGGNTTEMARARFERDVLAMQPQVVIIQFGINDAAIDVWKKPPATAPRVSLERYESNLRHFVRTLKSKAARVVLMTPNPLRWTPKLQEMYGRPPYQPEQPDGFNVLLARYAEAARRVAREEGAELIDVQRAYVARAEESAASLEALLPDGTHPSADGHRLVAGLLRAALPDLWPRAATGAGTKD
jgi:lysophospholipase L1-like esterase